MNETRFLSYIIETKEGLKATQINSAAANYARSKSVKGVRQFFGLVSFYRRFIPNFAIKAEQMNVIT